MNNNKDLLQTFKDSMIKASEISGTSISRLNRDEYIRIAVDNDINPRLNKVELNKLGGFAVVKAIAFGKDTEEEIVQVFIDFVSANNLTPSNDDLVKSGIKAEKLRKLGGLKGLLQKAKEIEPNLFNSLINDDTLREKSKNIEKQIKNVKRYIITTAVSGKSVDENFLNSIKTFEKKMNAKLLVQPCEDVANRGKLFKYELDSLLSDSIIVPKDLYLNEKIYLSSIMVSAKQINPLTGLDRLAQSKGSMILASPKQYLKFVANSNVKMPRALMTTGAITVSDYSTDAYMSKRTSYLAEFDHVIGAVIVEIQDKNVFHFRQIQADKDGSFIDLGKRYKSDGKVEVVKEAVCVFGDTHVGSHDLDVDKCLKQIVKEVNCKEIIVHDIFDCRFNNHHDIHKKATRAKLAMAKKTSLMNEGDITGKWIDEYTKLVNKVTIVKSNHDEALDRYIDEGRWKDDAENLYYALDLVKAFIEGKDVLKHLITNMIGIKNPDKVKWLDRDEDYKVYGIENGAHGDKGANGSRGGLNSLESAYYKATVGHSHTAGILRHIYQVGTSTIMRLGYNSGPSSWTNTMCIQYPNGSRQLINIIKPKDGKIAWKTTN